MQTEIITKSHILIASDRIEGTRVCRPGGEQIGTIQRLMINKGTGKVAYAVVKFGGVLGFGEKHFPVPWASLKYDLNSSAYEMEVTNDQLRTAPSFTPGEEFDWGDRSDEILIRHYPVRLGWA